MKLVDNTQQQQLRQIVNNLVKARKEKSLSIEEMAMKTLIRPALLQALEEGRFEDLPEPIFVQGFILRYGDALGLNGSSLAEQFIQISEPPKPKDEIPQKEKKTNIYIPIFFPYVVLLASVGAVLLYMHSISKTYNSVSKKTNSNTDTQQINLGELAVLNNTSIQEETSASVSKPAPSLTPSAKPSSNPQQVQANVKLQGESWLRVIVDDKKVFEGTLEQGTQRTWTGKKRILIRSGNAGAVLFSSNRQKEKILGKQGEIKDFVVTDERE